MFCFATFTYKYNTLLPLAWMCLLFNNFFLMLPYAWLKHEILIALRYLEIQGFCLYFCSFFLHSSLRLDRLPSMKTTVYLFTLIKLRLFLWSIVLAWKSLWSSWFFRPWILFSFLFLVVVRVFGTLLKLLLLGWYILFSDLLYVN